MHCKIINLRHYKLFKYKNCLLLNRRSEKLIPLHIKIDDRQIMLLVKF